jgi:hypothetical protein
MSHSVPHTGRVAVPWGLTSRRVDWLGGLASAVLRRALGVWKFNHRTPRLHVSDEWLEEYERRSHGRSD